MPLTVLKWTAKRDTHTALDPDPIWGVVGKVKQIERGYWRAWYDGRELGNWPTLDKAKAAVEGAYRNEEVRLD